MIVVSYSHAVIPATAGRPFRQVRVPRPLTGQVRLRVQPIPITEARIWCRIWHRTHRAPVGAVRAFGVYAGEELHGVALLGRPVSRMLAAQGWLEVTRVASDTTPNTCSALLGACAREARRRGAPVVVTYTLEDEPGTSLRAAGWTEDGLTSGGSWDRDDRERDESDVEDVRKVRWLRRLS